MQNCVYIYIYILFYILSVFGFFISTYWLLYLQLSDVPQSVDKNIILGIILDLKMFLKV